MAVVAMGSIARHTSMAYFSEGNDRSYQDLLLQNISAARLLFSQPLNLPEPHSAEGPQ
jgi:hypothetical protein